MEVTVCRLRRGSANVMADSEAEELCWFEVSDEVCLARREEKSWTGGGPAGEIINNVSTLLAGGEGSSSQSSKRRN